MAPNTVYVIVGANRGIGLGLVEAYLARSSTTVIGVVRSAAAAEALKTAGDKAIKGTDSELQVVELNFTTTSSPETARERFVEATSGITHINTLICSAGHVASMSSTLTVTAEDLRESFEVNAIAPLIAVQALWPLIEKGADATGAPPKFVVLSSSVGSIGAMEPFPGGSYGPSKAAVNHIVKSLHLQQEKSGLISIALHPGWVQTAMGDFAAKEWNYAAGPPDTVEDSVKGILNVLDGATRDTVSGKFVTQHGDDIPW